MQAEAARAHWLDVHRIRQEQEKAFAGLASRAVAGEVSFEELDALFQEIVALRARCAAAYEMAFPEAPKSCRPGSECGSCTPRNFGR